MLYRLSALALAANTYAASIPGGGPWGQPRGGPNFGRPSVPGSQGWHGQGQSAGSPSYDYMFEVPLPQGSTAQPSYTTEVNGIPIDYYEITIESFTQQVYPELGPAHLIGYNGSAPGPTFWVEKGRETVIRYLNNGNLSAAVHLHGSYTHAAWDGWAMDEMDVGQWKVCWMDLLVAYRGANINPGLLLPEHRECASDLVPRPRRRPHGYGCLLWSSWRLYHLRP